MVHKKLYGYDVRIKVDGEGCLIYHDPLDLAIYGKTRSHASASFREYMKNLDYNDSYQYINDPRNWNWLDSLISKVA